MERLRHRPRQEERGAAAVEFALLFPIFIMLCIGMISAGFAFERWIGLTQGVREADRYGATLSLKAISSTATVSDYVAQVASVARDATGVSTATPGQVVCVAVYSAGIWTSTGATTTSTPCFSDGRADDRVQVKVERSTDFNWVFASNTLTLSSQSVSVWEAEETAS